MVNSAAGNIFIGKYLATDGTDGVLGWGRPWTVAPKALKGWVKYTPATIQEKESNSDYPAGTMDKGVIYIAVLDNSANPEAYNGEFPVIVKTKNPPNSSARTIQMSSHMVRSSSTNPLPATE